jgi:acetyl-CoA C-acetyltransferase
MSQAYIIDAVRTPRGIGKVGKGALAQLHPYHVAATVLKALKERNNLNTAEVDDVIWGTSASLGKQGGNVGRMAALGAGYDPLASGVVLNRYCGSGITATSLAAAQIISGMEDLVISGGLEMMSHVNATIAEQAAAGLRSSGGMGGGYKTLEALHPQSHQGVCADAVAALEGYTREEMDALGLESQRRAAIAIREGRFDRTIVPVHDEEGVLVLAKDEYPRPDTTAADLAALKPSFGQIADMPAGPDGVTFRQLINKRYPDLKFEPIHHAGNSSGVVDGAAALLLASEDYARKHGLKPRARIVATANIGDDPTLMLNAPVPAAKKVLKKAGLTPDDIDLWEVNEAFAVVVERFIRGFNLDRNKINVNGGSIALGHPIAATGAILIGTVLDELERRDLKRGLVTMCAAGGMAPAVIIERV